MVERDHPEESMVGFVIAAVVVVAAVNDGFDFVSDMEIVQKTF